jgi:hydroxymethylbilane synthase
VAIEIRSDDEATRREIARIDDPDAADALTAERAVVEGLGGGCQTPVGALAAIVEDDVLDLMAVVVALDGSRAVRRQARGPRQDAASLGTRVAADLIACGAADILAEARRTQGAVEGIQP